MRRASVAHPHQIPSRPPALATRFQYLQLPDLCPSDSSFLDSLLKTFRGSFSLLRLSLDLTGSSTTVTPSTQFPRGSLQLQEVIYPLLASQAGCSSPPFFHI